mmetsp:Transcript_17682/g.31184  ORF Transcript_17682/g.31184 Transcript_17682/m.31184 type:complete len:83 (+) Transcript_17682:403-651(+)
MGSGDIVAVALVPDPARRGIAIVDVHTNTVGLTRRECPMLEAGRIEVAPGTSTSNGEHENQKELPHGVNTLRFQHRKKEKTW